MLNKLQFKLAKKAADEAIKAIETAQQNALLTGGNIMVFCHRNPQIVQGIADKLGFETEVKQVDFGYEVYLF